MNYYYVHFKESKSIFCDLLKDLQCPNTNPETCYPCNFGVGCMCSSHCHPYMHMYMCLRVNVA